MPRIHAFIDDRLVFEQHAATLHITLGGEPREYYTITREPLVVFLIPAVTNYIFIPRIHAYIDDRLAFDQRSATFHITLGGGHRSTKL